MRNVFSIPDPDINQEASVDPMGLQIIWTRFGQEIFADKITTIANDLRVFTFNIFHQHLITRLMTDCSEELNEAKKYYRTWQTEFDVKAGLLIFFEDLVTHIFYHTIENRQDAERIGILGLNKVRAQYHTYTTDKIYLSANKRMGILKNQLALGMTGRYKGPMMNMSFFDRSFTCLPQTWERVNHFISKWSDAISLQEDLLKLIRKQLLRTKNREYPRLSIDEMKTSGLWKSISEKYLQCFGKRKLPKDIRDFWKDKLGLNSGASGALYEEIAELRSNEEIVYEKIFSKASIRLKNDLTEQKKITDVLTVEPFLSHTEFLLRFLSQPNIKNVFDEKDELIELRALIHHSASFVISPSIPRLTELQQLMIKDGELTDWLQQVLSYHADIMVKRGGSKWVEMSETGVLKHYFSPTLPEYVNTIYKYIKERPWWHHYYLGTLWSIHQGLR